MDFLTIISTCSLHRDLGLVIAMAMTFSRGNPYAVEDASRSLDAQRTEFAGDARDKLSLESQPAPKTRVEAIAVYERIAANGGTPILGLLPVSGAWAVMFDKQPADIFDACVDVSIATAMLDEFAAHCGPKGRACVLHKYAEALQYESFADDVLASIRTNALPASAPVVVDTDAIVEAPIFVRTEGEPDWGADQIFFPGTNKPPAPAAGSMSTTRSADTAKRR